MSRRDVSLRRVLPFTSVVLTATIVGQGVVLATTALPPPPPTPPPPVVALPTELAALARRPFTLDEVRPPPTPAPAPRGNPVAPNDYGTEPYVVIGSIEIPRLGLAAPLGEGIALTTIDRGPSHWPGTAMPGDTGNVVIAGHRVTHSAPFRKIDKLEEGDEVIFSTEGRRSTYRVTGSEVVTPDAMRIVDQTPDATATLFACHPPGSARYRYVVKLALDSVNSTRPGSPILLGS
ncbi:MAG: class E sortase [Actinobacteria bacterium]|nr:class E sortase [Actinomycetota bacterium]